MPSSTDLGKEDILKWFRKQRDIRTILDIGPGSGTYAKLLGPGYRWIGIEVWEPYIEQFNLNELYDEIINEDLRSYNWPEADCIIFGDVIEHLPKEDAMIAIDLAKSYKHCVISLPVGLWPQGEINGNIFESHVSEWDDYSTREQFKDWTQLLYPRISVFLR